MRVYMKVSKDKYELPVAVAATMQELAMMCGTSVNAINSAICHSKVRGGRCVYVKVEIDDE